MAASSLSRGLLWRATKTRGQLTPPSLPHLSAPLRRREDFPQNRPDSSRGLHKPSHVHIRTSTDAASECRRTSTGCHEILDRRIPRTRGMPSMRISCLGAAGRRVLSPSLRIADNAGGTGKNKADLFGRRDSPATLPGAPFSNCEGPRKPVLRRVESVNKIDRCYRYSTII